jgi:hypothetical protein
MEYSKVLEVPWHAYRTWAGTARFLKSDLSRWTRYTLWLAIAGAVLAAAAQEFSVLPALKDWQDLAKGAALLASFAVALCAYFGKEALTGNKTSDWVKARSAAESLKSATYLYRTGAPPFDTADRTRILFDTVAAIEQRVGSIQTQLAAPESTPDLAPLSVDDYIQKRVDDQILFYDKRADEYQKRNGTLRNFTFWLGAASVVLALVALSGAAAALIGLIATLTASLSAHAQNQQYQTLIVTYQATSRRLTALKGQWIASEKTDADTAERNAFIKSCEDTMALENSAWVGDFVQKQAPAEQAEEQAPAHPTQ